MFCLRNGERERERQREREREREILKIEFQFVSMHVKQRLLNIFKKYIYRYMTVFFFQIVNH